MLRAGRLTGPMTIERSCDSDALSSRAARPGSPRRECFVTRRRVRCPTPAAMGFNPERQHRRSPWDLVFVGAALLTAAALVLWAFLG